MRLAFARFTQRRPLFSALLGCALLAAAAGPLLAQAPNQIPASGLPASGLKDMQEIAAFKASFTPAEQKMSTALILASRAAAGKPLGAMARYYAAPARDTEGRILVDVLGFATPALLRSPNVAAFDAVGEAQPSATYLRAHLRAHVRPERLANLAAESDVTTLREATGRITNVGSVTSQGYVSHGANRTVPTGINGSGIRVGVLSDSALPARVAALIASGDLPANVVVLPGQAGPSTGENEGAAMMEIVHDIAPGAQLFFASAFNSEASFAANIETLRFTYGCDIIVDDVSYFDEPVFQDGLVAQAVNAVTASGALYFSSAANSGNLDSGTSGTWEGDFTPSGITLSSAKGAASVLNFGTAASSTFYDTLTTSPSSGVWLHWADPNGGSFNDYDLYIFNNNFSTVKAFSNAIQNGSQDPLEYVYPSTATVCASATPTGYCPAAGDQIVVALSSGAPRAIHIDTERAQLSIGTSGATFGHNAAASTFSMAATYWNAAHTGARLFTGGPANPVETFSSDGPRKIFYYPDGTPITPANFLFSTNGGITLQKPDATGADGVSTATPGFTPFFGTSAAAPHAAAIAALVKSANPSLTNTQIRNILTNTTLDNMAPGVDRDSGYGILLAPPAVAAAQSLMIWQP